MSWYDWLIPPKTDNLEVTVLKNSIEAMRIQMNALSTNQAALQGKVDGLHKQLVALNDNTVASVGALEALVNDLSRIIGELLEQLSALEDAGDSGASVTELGARIERVSTTLTAMEQHLVEFEELVIQQFETDAAP
jgi:hypothetical protein